jgi:hypothetical protein
MAQHDYDIANQSGANFRADLNNALDAIVSNNSGSSEPSTTFAYEWWIDTSANVLKLRNSANNAWITLPLSITADNSTSGALTVNGNLSTTGTLDVNGGEVILDADADTSITADSDDQIDFRVGAVDVMTLTNSHLVLKGTTPKITIGDGGAEDTALIFDGNAQDFYIGLDDSADDLIIGKGSTVGTTPAIIIDENLKVGIGAVTPQTSLHIRTQEATSNHNSGGGFALTSNATAGSRRVELFLDADNGNFSTSSDGAYAYLEKIGGGGNFNIRNQDNSPIAFFQSSSERMRIDSSGNVFVGATSTGGTIAAKIEANGGTDGRCMQTKVTGTGSANAITFNNGNGQVGFIATSGSSTTYGTSSDYRLKENVIDMTNAISRVKELQPKRFNFTADAETTLDGFLAHEVSDVVPEAITGEKDDIDDDGNPIYQGIDQSKLVPLLTKAIQEQQDIIEDLKTRIETLEG